jgi:hypothetical protein
MLLTVTRPDFIPINKIVSAEEKVIVYHDFLTTETIKKLSHQSSNKTIDFLRSSLVKITGKFYQPKRNKNLCGFHGSIVFVSLKTMKFVLRSKSSKTGKNKIIEIKKGTIVFLGMSVREKWSYQIPQHSVKFYEQYPLSYIYFLPFRRINFARSIKHELGFIKKMPVGHQCLQKYLGLTQIIGQGCYGNVYKTSINGMVFAVKLSKLKADAWKNPFCQDISSWHEVFFLQKIIRPIIRKNICPNLPLLFETFSCNNCILNIKGQKSNNPCVITVIEYADGDLNQFLSTNRDTKELYSALFQIMAALHALQFYGQVMNFDIKKENILYYNIQAGGYWHYIVHGKDFFIPNYGKLFILNDFGISRTMSPKFPVCKNKSDQTFRLGSRYAIVYRKRFVPLETKFQINEKGQKEQPLLINWSNGQTSFGAQFRLCRKTDKIFPLQTILCTKIKKHLRSLGVSIQPTSKRFFQQSEIIPPFEFYNDTQDVIRMFIGGKRTTQRGYHRLLKINKNFQQELSVYNGPGESMQNGIFSTDVAQVLAGYFIEKFFRCYRKNGRKKNIISVHQIS